MHAPGPVAEIVVVGAGAWGTALACVLATDGRPVALWARSPAQRQQIRVDRVNPGYLPGIVLPGSIEVVDELSRLPPDCHTALLATPCQVTRETVSHLRRVAPGIKAFICSAKGLELGTQRLIHEVVAEVFAAPVPIAILSGPTFAREVAEGRPAAVTIAANDTLFGRTLVERFHTPRFRAYLSDDLAGVALGGSVKNVLAIAAGIADGLGLGANSRAALITRGLAELARLGLALGARQETFMGLSGLGDLVLTCTDDQSRNRRFGLALGHGLDVTAARTAIGLVEGESTALALADMAARLGIRMPIATEVARIVRGETRPAEAVNALMMREPGPEFGT